MSSSDDFLKPKNQTFEPPKKAEQVFIPDLHSNPELMSYSEKLELAEEILSEIFNSVLTREGIKGEVKDVEGSQIVLGLSGQISAILKMELEYLVSETTQGVFSLKLS